MRHVLFTVLTLLLTTTAFAAPRGSVSGRVVDKESKIPIAGATVQVLGTDRGTFARSNGTFTLLKVDDGSQKVIVKSIGYLADTVDIEIGNNTPFLVVELKGAVVTSDGVVVLGDQAKGQAKAFNQQRSGLNVTNIVSADQIGRFPDQNIGDAMKRIPGIAVQYDQGEARFGLIRGTPGQLNSVMINGERIPSAEAEDRQVQLDLIPADMVRAIEVNKTLTPDMDADAIGGAVNLVTRDAASGTRVSATLGSGYNFLSGKPMIIGSAIGGTRLADDKLGVIVSGSYFDHILGSDNMEAEWDQDDNDNPFVSEMQLRTYEVRRIRRSFSTGLDYRFDPNNTLRLSAIYNHRDDWENRWRTVYKDIDSDGTVGKIERQTKGGISGDPTGGARLEDQRMYNFTLAGEHVIADVVRLSWHGTLAKASEERSNERYLEWDTKETNSTVVGTDPRKPSINDGSNLDDFEFSELTEEYQFTEDIDRNGRIDMNFNWLEGDFGNLVKAGVRIRTKTKNRGNNFFEYAPVDGNAAFDRMTLQPLENKSKDNFLAGPYAAGEYSSKNALGDYDLLNASQFEREDLVDEYAPGNFSADENIFGGYVMVEQQLGPQLEAVVGVRFEQTNNNYTGNQFDVDDETVTSITNESSYSNILPSLNLKYSATDNLIIRGAVTTALARPNYFDLVPYRIINREDQELEVGNPNLEATTALNFDLMGEYYMQPVGIIQVGVFHKQLDKFIFTYLDENYTDPVTGEEFDRFTQPRNGGDATITGVEVALQRQLDFLPGALGGFGIYLNYTYSTSSVNGIQGREGEDLPLAGNPNNTFNASLSYEWGGFMARVAANYTSSYIDEYAGGPFFDRYYDDQLFVDANVSFAFTPQFRVFVDANNLTNQPLRYFQGTADQVMQIEFYNARFQAGIKYDL